MDNSLSKMSHIIDDSKVSDAWIEEIKSSIHALKAK